MKVMRVLTLCVLLSCGLGGRHGRLPQAKPLPKPKPSQRRSGMVRHKKRLYLVLDGSADLGDLLRTHEHGVRGPKNSRLDPQLVAPVDPIEIAFNMA